VELGDVMEGATVGEVVASDDQAFAPGDTVMGGHRAVKWRRWTDSRHIGIYAGSGWQL